MGENKNNKKSFRTSFGKTIDFVPGYIDFIKKTISLPEEAQECFEYGSINQVGGHENINYDEVNKRLKEKRRLLSLYGYASRLYRVYLFMDLLNNTYLSPPFKKCLDIGSGFGIQPRIIKALGLAQEVVANDIYDRASNIEEKTLKRRHRQYRYLRILELIQKFTLRVPQSSRSNLQRAILEKIRTPRYQFLEWVPDNGFYKLKFKNEPKLDRLIIGDIFKVEEKFDLITSFSSLDWFEAKSIFHKISDLLEIGGVFYMCVGNWWCPETGTTLAGHFPYAYQRLTKNDYFRYLEEHLPRYAEAMKIRYQYFDPNHPTLSQYIDIAYENGLIPLSYRSLIRRESNDMKRGIHSLGYFEFDYAEIRNILEDINKFRPDVRLSDLLPSYYAIIFKKVNKNNKINEHKLQKFYGDTDFHYRPTNPIMRALRHVTLQLIYKKDTTTSGQ